MAVAWARVEEGSTETKVAAAVREATWAERVLTWSVRDLIKMSCPVILSVTAEVAVGWSVAR